MGAALKCSVLLHIHGKDMETKVHEDYHKVLCRGHGDSSGVDNVSSMTAERNTTRSTSTALFEWRQGCEALWFSSGLAQDYVSSSKYLYAGFLFASAVANQCYLDLKLPLLFFEKLLNDRRTD